MDVTNSEKSDNQQIVIQSNNYNVTVIPLEFNRNRVYNTQNSDYVVEQYSEYPGRTHDDYVQTEELSSSQGALYSVSQRLPPVSSSYSSLCATEAGYTADPVNYPGMQQDWDRERAVSTTDTNKDTSSDGSDKQTNDSITASIPSSTVSNAPTTSNSEPLQGPIIPTSVFLHNRTAVVMEIEDTPTATSDLICQAIVNSDELGLNKQLASQVFSLWMVSPLLELQLKPSHRPYETRQYWRALVEQYSHASYNRQQRDEPKLTFQRNVFFPQHLEEKIKSAYFEGQVEQPVHGLTSLLTHQDIPVLVAINSKGLYIVDDLQCSILLGLRFEEFSWEYARPSKEEDPNCLPCLFIQFLVVENGARVSKILQVFSRQASLMDTLITVFVTQLKSRSNDETDTAFENQTSNENENHSSLVMGTTHSTTLPSLSNKLNRLTLATFDEDGHCIGQMGSWSFSY